MTLAGSKEKETELEILCLLPSPTSEATPIPPPCSSVSSREINNPSPDPPYRVWVRGSAWENRWNKRVFSSEDKPLPVSWTVQARYRCSSWTQLRLRVWSDFGDPALDGNHSIGPSSSLRGLLIDMCMVTVTFLLIECFVNLIACWLSAGNIETLKSESYIGQKVDEDLESISTFNHPKSREQYLTWLIRDGSMRTQSIL